MNDLLLRFEVKEESQVVDTKEAQLGGIGYKNYYEVLNPESAGVENGAYPKVPRCRN